MNRNRKITTLVIALILAGSVFFAVRSNYAGIDESKVVTSYNDFLDNDGDTSATTKSEVVVNGSGDPDNATAGTVTQSTVDWIGVVDYNNSRVKIFDSMGEVVMIIASNQAATTAGPSAMANTPDTSSYIIDQPRGVAVDADGNIYASSTTDNRVMQYTSQGVFIKGMGSGTMWTGATNSAGTVGNVNKWFFNVPIGMSVNSIGNIAISQKSAGRVMLYDSNFDFVRGIGAGSTWTTDAAPSASAGTKIGEFSGDGSYDVFLADDGKIYASDYVGDRIQVFNSDGSFALGIGAGTSWTDDVTGTTTDVATVGVNAGNGAFNGPRGVFVDGDGNIYVADALNYQIQKFNSAGVFQMGIGGGTVWTGTHPGAFSEGTQGVIGEFSSCQGIAVGATSGNIYVTDSWIAGDNYRVQVFDSSGGFLWALGNGVVWTSGNGTETPGIGNYYFGSTNSMDIDANENIYIADRANHRVLVYDSAGVFVRGIGSGTTWDGVIAVEGTKNGYFNDPNFVTFDKYLNIYVSESANDRVSIFDSTGAFVRGIGNGTTWTAGTPAPTPSPGTADGEFTWPRGVDVYEPTGDIYVTDGTNNNIQIFNSAGVFQSKMSTGNIPAGIHVAGVDEIYVAEVGPDDISLLNSAGETLSETGTGSGLSNGQFGNLNAPYGVAVDSSGNMYGVDGGSGQRVQIFNSAGTFVRGIGSGTTWTAGTEAPAVVAGAENSQFESPRGMAVDSDGYIYVVDAANDRIQIFNSVGEFVRGIGSGTVWVGDAPTLVAGKGTLDFDWPLGICLGSSPHRFSGTIGGAEESDIGLRVDTGAENQANWKTLTVAKDLVGTNDSYAVKAKIRGADTTGALDEATWYGPGGATTASDWTTAGGYFGQVYGSAATSTTIPAAFSGPRYAEAMVRLEGDTLDTPILQSVSFTYDTMVPPIAGNLKQYKTASGGEGEISGGGWTNETAIVLKASGVAGLPTSTSPKVEFEVKEYSPSNVAFSSGLDGSVISGGISGLQAEGLASGKQYKWRARVVDAEERETAWTLAPTSDPDFKVDTVAPTGGSITYTNGILNGTSINVSFVNGTDALSGISSRVIQRAEATIAGGAAGAYGGFILEIVSNPSSSPDTNTGLTPGKAYKYRYVVTDAAGNAATYTSSNEVLTAGSATALSLSEPANFTAGTWSEYAVSLTDAFGNAKDSSGTTTANLSSTSGSGEFSLTEDGSTVTSVGITDGNDSAAFWYYDETAGTPTITAAHATLTNATDIISVTGAAVDALILSAPADLGVGNAAQYLLTKVDEFDNPTTTLTGFTVTTGAAPTPATGSTTSSYAMDNPRGATGDSDGNVYVTSIDWDRVLKYNSAGEFVMGMGGGTRWTTATSPASTSSGRSKWYFENPMGISVNSAGYIVIAHQTGEMVTVYDSAFDFVRGIGSGQTWTTDNAPGSAAGTQIGRFGGSAPYDVHIDDNNTIYASDYGQNRLMVYNSNGTFKLGIGAGTSWSGQALGEAAAVNTTADSNLDGGFDRPRGIWADAAGNIYTCDIGFSRIQKFNSAGAFVMGIGHGTTWTAGGANRPTPANWTTQGPAGEIYGFYYANGIAVGATSGNIYVSDSGPSTANARVQIFNSVGEFILGIGNGTVWTSGDKATVYGTANYYFKTLDQIGVDDEENIYISDRDNERVVVYDSAGAFKLGIGAGTTWKTEALVGLGSTSYGPNKEFRLTADGSEVSSIAFASGAATADFYYYDEAAGTWTITATDTGVTTGTDVITFTPGAATSLSVSSPSDITAGNSAQYTVTRADTYGNNATSGTTTVNLATTSSGANKKFSATEGGGTISSINITDTNASVNFWYYDDVSGSHTITISSESPSTSVADVLGVDPAAADHLQFANTTETTQVAGTAFNLAALQAVDAYDNLVTAYTGTKTIAFVITTGTGTANGPTSGTDSYTNGTNAVAFTSGESTTDLATTLYRTQDDVTITADDTALPTAVANEASGLIDVGSANTSDIFLSDVVNLVADVEVEYTITRKDTYGNLVTGYDTREKAAPATRTSTNLIGAFADNTALSVDSEGNVWVGTDGDFVQKFDSAGAFLMGIGRGTLVTSGSLGDAWPAGSNATIGGFSYAAGIAVDADDNLYVADKDYDKVQKFTSQGAFVLAFDGDTQWAGSYGDALPAADNHVNLNKPMGVAADAAGNVYVGNYDAKKITKFNSAGVYITGWLTESVSNGRPLSLAFDDVKGYVFVAKEGQVARFNSVGGSVVDVVSTGNAYGVGVDSSSNVYVE